ncbi:MAG TPA: serine hydrolase, partial [Ferruginibacter sp.]|nr:serine hydrolase [Ferruginibacter sp.]
MLHDGTYGAMGGMITTMEDFSKYVAFQLSAWPPRDDADNGPVKRSSVREMQFPWNFGSLNAQYKYPSGRACPLVSAYAYGLRWTKDCEGRVTVGHSGGLPGFGSNWLILPEHGIGIICFCNMTYAPVSGLNYDALDKLISAANLKPRQIAVSPILQQRQNELVKILPDWKNAEATHIFAENFFLDYFPDALHMEATELFNKAGKITGVGPFTAENNLRGSFILQGENIDIEVSFTLTPENPPLIQEYHIREKKK